MVRHESRAEAESQLTGGAIERGCIFGAPMMKKLYDEQCIVEKRKV
jgi:hypothetical protein